MPAAVSETTTVMPDEGPASTPCCGACGGKDVDGRDTSPASWPGVSGPSVAARRGGDGPDKPGHDDARAADHAPTATYQNRRSELLHYFDRTAVDAWKRLTSDAPVNRIRATVRAGRDDMRNTLLSRNF